MTTVSIFGRSARALGLGPVFLFLVVFAPAQSSESGGITGMVKDPSGAVVRGATVEVFNLETGVMERRVTTNADGLYTAGLLRPGPYRVEVTDQGFGKCVAALAVRLNELERHDVTLEVGTFQLEIMFKPSEPWSTHNATTGQPIDNHTLTALPLAEPNYLFLLGLSTGTSTEPPDMALRPRHVDISVTDNAPRTTASRLKELMLMISILRTLIISPSLILRRSRSLKPRPRSTMRLLAAKVAVRWHWS